MSGFVATPDTNANLVTNLKGLPQKAEKSQAKPVAGLQWPELARTELGAADRRSS
ncbi:hypothetical protein [Collimonas pratensis]|uniref:hypothetical protein n=1 Tax=Collimonas pratensis TaxID=279113 RepID=UPI00143114F5|nr:hypothetical protein [Collimonas pratensis]